MECGRRNLSSQRRGLSSSMRATILSIGERMPDWIAVGLAEYRKRLGRELPLELVTVRSGLRTRNQPIQRAIEMEGAAMLARVSAADRVIALDGRGQPWSSEVLAKQLAGWRMDGRNLVFLIGGADGLAPALLDRAELRWSLGTLTLPHMLVRVIVAEQLYRAMCQLSGHPYHRG